MRLQSFMTAAAWLAMLPQYADASTVRLSRRDNQPNLPVKAGTASDCNFWYDNWDGDSCEVARDWIFAIPPWQFSQWNPSITLDCKGWEDWHSYCVRVGSASPSSTTSSKPPTTTTTTSTAAPPRPTVSRWKPLGCYVETNTLSTKSTREGGSALTVEKCQAACWLDGFDFAGLKSGSECWCGAYVGGSKASDQTACKTPCTGNSAQTCGGDKLLDVFLAVVDVSPPSNPVGSVTTTGTSSAATTTTTAAASATWVPQGCYKDLAPDVVRPLPNRLINGGSSLTIQSCQAACLGGGYTMAGVENGTQCFCGHDIQEPAKNTPALESECTKPCVGNSAQTCGNAARIFIYRYAVPRQVAWQPLGCHMDLAPTTARPLPDRLLQSESGVTIDVCKTLCRDNGDTLAGLENGNQCFCGNEIQVPDVNVWVSPTECAKPCTGNKSQTCGDRARMYIYQLSAPERKVWRSVGCYKDLYPSASRTLDAMLRSGSTVTIDSCHALCEASLYKYAGLENGTQCWCGNDIRDPAANVLTAMSECGTACAGNKAQTCGSGARVHIYESVSA